MAAGKSKGVHHVVVDDFKGDRHVDVRVAHQVLTQPVNVFGKKGLLDQLGLTLDFDRQLLTQGNLFFDGIEVDSLADVPISNLFGVLLFLVAGQAEDGYNGENGDGRQPAQHIGGLLNRVSYATEQGSVTGKSHTLPPVFIRLTLQWDGEGTIRIQ